MSQESTLTAAVVGIGMFCLLLFMNCAGQQSHDELKEVTCGHLIVAHASDLYPGHPCIEHIKDFKHLREDQ